MMDLLEKIRKIEALIAGAKTQGERQAAELAKQRLEGKIAAQPVEFTIRLHNIWQKKLFVAICAKYQLKPYRYARQKYTTSMVRANPALLKEIVLPEFQKFDKIFEELANEIMADLISKIHQIPEEEMVIAGELPPG